MRLCKLAIVTSRSPSHEAGPPKLGKRDSRSRKRSSQRKGPAIWCTPRGNRECHWEEWRSVSSGVMAPVEFSQSRRELPASLSGPGSGGIVNSIWLR